MASPLTLAHIEGERRLRETTKQGLTRIWRGLPGLDRPNLDQWLSEALPLVLAAQRSSAKLTQAYLARAIERPPAGIDLTEVIGAAARSGTPPEEVYTRPFVTVWSELAGGKAWDVASGMGLERATTAGAMDVQLAMRGTANAVQRAQDNIFGFQRVADGGACEFCLEIDGAYTKDADAMPLHNNCGCGLEPLIGVHERAVHLPDGTRVRDVQFGALNADGVAVHQHGEYGATLTAADHNFMTEAEANAR